jgi:hypothetical protein
MFNNFQNILFTRVNYIITAAYCFVNRLIMKNTGFFFPATGYLGKMHSMLLTFQDIKCIITNINDIA